MAESDENKNWLNADELRVVVEKSSLVSHDMSALITNLTKNINELLEKRGVKLLMLPKNKSVEERLSDLEKKVFKK